MINQNRIFIVTVISAALFIGSLVTLAGRSQDNKQTGRKVDESSLAKQIDDLATPVVDLANPDTEDRLDKKARATKSKRYDNSGAVKIDSYFGGGDVRSDPEWRSGFSDLPAGQSDLIVEAAVVGSKAFLSEDRTGIYSEFTIAISSILKVGSGISVNVGDKVVAERFGGRVRYPSGQVIRWRISRQGTPTIGNKYLFFLKADDDTYKLLTGYQLENNKIITLDGSRTENGRQGASIFDKHNGQDLVSFMREVERAIQDAAGSKKP